jgi:hypothetical protein
MQSRLNRVLAASEHGGFEVVGQPPGHFRPRLAVDGDFLGLNRYPEAFTHMDGFSNIRAVLVWHGGVPQEDTADGLP